MNNKDFSKLIPTILQLALNIALTLLAITLCILMGKELIYFINHSILASKSLDNYELLEHILIFFLYFEFVAMIIKYFKENYHFPLRYFLYIGITAMIRLIIVSHENGLQTLLYSCAILVLIISYFIISRAKGNKE
ncbi:phosphate-starvation-inducible protein PsiE [Bacillus sp. AGMB 02131]|uniref:Protein PsiE n=1 Tax=Peribacillus faecalis TaxID=2772559 RepID=A0A927D291_9BACI|nr:phosphate-starvation-inducible protein PsiE [Peribacillus faecalis]MBD3110230.1 phosphate-starvation-inducible protein PsiE [Peribacillus faecalis]